jgi:hypothetical protein
LTNAAFRVACQQLYNTLVNNPEMDIQYIICMWFVVLALQTNASLEGKRESLGINISKQGFLKEPQPVQ